MTSSARADRLDREVDPERDHALGGLAPQVTLVEYGSYLCTYCHAAHEVIGRLRDRFGDRLRYVYRHLPLADRDEAKRAALLAEYAAAHTGDFWRAHDALMRLDEQLVQSTRMVEAATKAGHKLARAEVRLPTGPLRTVGEHVVAVHLHTDIDIQLPVIITAED